MIYDAIQIAFKAKTLKAMTLAEGEYPLAFCRSYIDKNDEQTKADTEYIKESSGFSKRKTFKPIILDNEPLMGYRIIPSSDESFILQDPRGFQVRQSKQQMDDIIRTMIIREGFIETECMWSFGDSENPTIVSVDSDEYKTYASTIVHKEDDTAMTKVTMKTLKPTNLYKDELGRDVVYFGKCNLYTTYKVDKTSEIKKCSSEKMHLMATLPKTIKREGSRYGKKIYQELSLIPQKTIGGIYIPDKTVDGKLYDFCSQAVNVINGAVQELNDSVADEMRTCVINIENMNLLIPENTTYVKLDGIILANQGK